MRLFAYALLFFSAENFYAAEPAATHNSDNRTATYQALKPDSGISKPELTEDMVRIWLRVWQNRLDLGMWQIGIKVVSKDELPEGAIANIHWNTPTYKATIKVLRSADSSLKAEIIIGDAELSVVHELVHLTMARLPLDSNHTQNEEDTVIKISAALLRLDRRP